MGRNALFPANKTQPLCRGRFDVDAGDIHSEIRCDRITHACDEVAEAWPLRDDCQINVPDNPTALRQF